MFLPMPVMGGRFYSTLNHLHTPCRFITDVTLCLLDSESSNRLSLNEKTGERLCLMMESARGPRLPGMHSTVELSYCPPVTGRCGAMTRK